MKILKRMKDGGEESKVTGFFLIEIKSLFSVVLLRFDNGSREAFHSHAFNSVSLVLKGMLVEQELNGSKHFHPWGVGVWTPRSMFHQVKSKGTTWVLSFRGPWADTWNEFLPETEEHLTLTHGREIVERW